MTTILTIKYVSDCVDAEFIWIKEQDGSYIACASNRRRFKTLNGAKRYLRKEGYDVK